jgi:serine/threonine protein kinase
MNSSSPLSPRSEAVSARGSAALLEEAGPSAPGRRNLILEVRDLYRQGDPRPVETVLSRHPQAARFESLVFDLIHEEFYQRDRDGRLADPKEFDQRFAGWGINFDQFLEAKELIENHLDSLTACEDIPECLRNFQVLGLLGRGQFGQVYLATQPALGDRMVVLKVSDDGAAEANTLGRLDHPNIVPVYSAHHDTASGLTVVCMPYLGSATLEDVAQARRLCQTPPRSPRMIWESIQDSAAPNFHAPESKSAPSWLRRGSYVNAVLYLGRQLAQALAFVHEQGIFHRDLKPSNVLMTLDGRPMLLDFNLSRHKQLPDNRVAGTIVYMPPEQLAALHPGNKSGSPILIDERSDLFSLAVILYELLTGGFPFGAIPLQEKPKEAGAEWFVKQKAGPVPLRKMNPHVDAAAARIIDRCLAFDPQDRPRNAHELAAALGRLTSPMGRTRRWASLRVPLLSMVICLGLAATASTAYFLVPKEPYSLRQLHVGWDHYRQGRYDDALQHLMRSVEADRFNAEARYARGRVFLRLRQYEAAVADFEAADDLAGGKDARVKACMGYCSNLIGAPEVAIVRYGQAQTLNFATPGMSNNLGFSYMEWKSPQTKPDDSLDRAEQFLTEALRLNERLQPAYYNRAQVDLRRAGLNPLHLPRQGLADIRKAIELGPASAPLYWDAACLSCLVANRQGRQDSETLEFLNAAVDNGIDPAKLQNDFIFQQLAADGRFLAILQKKPNPNIQKEAVKLVDPIQD